MPTPAELITSKNNQIDTQKIPKPSIQSVYEQEVLVNSPKSNDNFSSTQNVTEEAKIVPNIYECSICDSIFPRRFDLDRHIELVHVKKKYMCTKCNANFSGQELLDQHNELVHPIPTFTYHAKKHKVFHKPICVCPF